MVIEHQFAGDFEVHLTVRPPSDESRLVEWAADRGLRYTRIVLDRGSVPDQPMLTFTVSGMLADANQVVKDHARALRAAGFALVRAKIEASPFNEQIPQTTEQVVALPTGCYFEHHVKLVLGGEADVLRVRALAEPHAAHVSRNARRSASHGRHERFVTQRAHDVVLSEAGGRLEALLADLAAAGFSAIEVEREFVVYDDHPGLDAGWITESPVVAP
ncbi:hypothetical protein OHA40_22110 [Nocardia sp. NBC_00508]|uniref:hypothetical protein n=1 Tax=Nocardia sp. NBC_00508 TaxID=2975992 RepID=UPI002E81E09D|nr:hypothetical protein [Nocardia sp. NBC_00508]WUD64387.1 hypothetical protein OHA40_22110 [Nocardia sp. NBC_00508]